MKRSRWLTIGLVVLCLVVIVLLAGCVSKSEFEALQVEYTALIAEKQSVQAEKATLVEEKQSLETERDKLSSEKAIVVKEKESLQTKYDELNAEHETLQAEYTDLKAENKSLEADYKATNSELAEIKKFYPPRDFSSLKELQDWLFANGVSERPVSTTVENWYSKALQIQEDALKDGYIVSVDLDYDPETEGFYIACVTIINGDIWAWDPEADEPVQYYYLGKVK